MKVWLVFLLLTRALQLTRTGSFNNPLEKEALMRETEEEIRNEEEEEMEEEQQMENCEICHKKGGGSIEFLEDTGNLKQRRDRKAGTWETQMSIGCTEENSDQLLDFVVVDAPEPFNQQWFTVKLDNPILATEADTAKISEVMKERGKDLSDIMKAKALLYLTQRCFRLTVAMGVIWAPRNQWEAVLNRWGLQTIQQFPSVNDKLQSVKVSGAVLSELNEKNKDAIIAENDLQKPYYARAQVGLEADVRGGFRSSYMSTFSGGDSEPIEFKIKAEYPLFRGEWPYVLTFANFEMPGTRSVPVPSTTVRQMDRLYRDQCRAALRPSPGGGTGYNQIWSCDDMDECVYSRYVPQTKFYQVKVFDKWPLLGIFRVEEGKHQSTNCRQRRHWEGDSKRECAIRLKSIWPEVVTPVTMRVLNPPKYKGEAAWLTLDAGRTPLRVDFSTTSRMPQMPKMPTTGVEEIVPPPPLKKIVCFGGSPKDPACENILEKKPYKEYTGTAFYSKRWSNRFTLLVKNPKGRALTPNILLPIAATVESSALWVDTHMAYHPLDGVMKERKLYFFPKQPGKIKIELEFVPEKPRVGDEVRVFVELKNKENSWRKGNFFKPKGALSHAFQRCSVTLVPMGPRITGTNSVVKQQKIGLDPKKNKVRINGGRMDKPFGLFVATAPGPQCIKVVITPTKKREYYDNKNKAGPNRCVVVAEGLKAFWADKEQSAKVIELRNKVESMPLKLRLPTGSAKLRGTVVFASKVSGQVMAYQLAMTPAVPSTERDVNGNKCTKNCVWKVTFKPNLVCVFDKDTGKNKRSARIFFSGHYTVGTSVIKITPPPSLRVQILENDEDMHLLKTQNPAEYKRIRRCRGIVEEEALDNPRPKACAGNASMETAAEEKLGEENAKNASANATAVLDCVPTDEFDSDRELQEDLERDQTEHREWWDDFWQSDWTWQYMVLGAATVCLMFDALKMAGFLGSESVLVEALDLMAAEFEAGNIEDDEEEEIATE